MTSSERRNTQTGTFKPAIPKDSQDVLRLYAIAARVVCDKPEQLAEINQRLQTIRSQLVPPESYTADECTKLWSVFVAVAQYEKPSLNIEAGKALYRDLDMLGQRLELAPMDPWDYIPAGIDDGELSEVSTVGGSDTLQKVRKLAKAKIKKQSRRKTLRMQEILEFLMRLDPKELNKLFEELVGQGKVRRGDITIVERYLLKGGKLDKEQSALMQAILKLGDALLQ